MLSNTGLGKEFWAEAINTRCYLVNRSPNTSIECKTPEEVWSGKLADYSNLRVFGCPAYVHVNEEKLEARASASRSPTLGKNEKVEQHIRKKTRKPNIIRF